MPDLTGDLQLYGLATALGIGLLIGLEREKNKGQGPDREAAGVRTFSLASLLGAVGYLTVGAWGIALAVIVVTTMAVAGYLRSRSTDPGLTTEVALVLTCALGGLAQISAPLSAALGVLIALLLVARHWLHSMVRQRLSDQELTDAVLLAAAALVVLPLLPDKAIDPFGVLNPRVIWTLAVVVMMINAGGYVAVRALGTHAGLPLAGLAGGFVSSVATIGAMGYRARENPAQSRAAAAGAALSSVATVVQLGVVLAITNSALLAPLWLALASAGLVAIAYGGSFAVRSLRTPDTGATEQQGRAFQPRTALIFAAMVTAVLFVSAFLQHTFGSAGGLAGIALAGFADAHSAAASAASLARYGGMASSTALLAVLLGFTTNTLTKAAAAWVSGGPRFAAKLSPGLLLMLAAAWAGAGPALRFTGP